jgi:hypothetical protein
VSTPVPFGSAEVYKPTVGNSLGSPLDSAPHCMLSYSPQARPPYIGRVCVHYAAAGNGAGRRVGLSAYRSSSALIQHGEAQEMSMWNIIFFIDRPEGGLAAQGRGAPIFG